VIQPRVDVRIAADAHALAIEAAQVLTLVASAAVAGRGRFVLALSGGSTPAPLYRFLASSAADAAFPWDRTHLIWGDERCVPAGDPQSNYGSAASTGLLGRPCSAVHRMLGELPPEEGAAAYEAELRGLWPGGAGTWPRVDAVLLGLGADGHTASLFPGSPALAEAARWVVATEPHAGQRRLTLTLPVLRRARLLVFLVAGREKAAVAARALSGGAPDLPSARVMEPMPGLDDHCVVWLFDQEAAGDLSPVAAGGRRCRADGIRALESETRGEVRRVPVTKVLLDGEQLQRTLARIAHEVAEQSELEGLALVGIQRRGVQLAERLAGMLAEFCGSRPPTGAIDIAFYRDDIDTRAPGPAYDQPVVHSTMLPFDVGGRTIVLVDDVLFTGRTIRAAIDALFDYGRPAAVRLAVLIDRGHRELPIRPDFVGKNVPTSRSELVSVRLAELDGIDEVVLERSEQGAA
jgi:6-phosphogluconolactonase